ncbi:MAG: phosphatidate cytidylyltransferase [Lautropia sp.]
MLRQRVITALVLLFAVLGALFLAPPWGWGLLSLAGLVAATLEWMRLLAGGARVPAVAIGVAVACGAWLMWREAGGVPGAWLGWLIAADLLLWIGVAVPAVLGARPPRSGLAWVRIGFAALALFSLWVALYELRVIHPAMLLSTMAVVWAADIGAYFVGRAFGRHKLAPRVSPGKSWEGALGGLGFVLACALVVALAWPSPSILPGWLALRVGTPAMLGWMVVLVALSVVGDLFESLLKRRRGVKDSGSLFPGHGGILDRIDALVPTVPACLLLTIMYA